MLQLLMVWLPWVVSSAKLGLIMAGTDSFSVD